MEPCTGTLQFENASAGNKKRIAIVGLNLLDGDTPELKEALHHSLVNRPDWRLIFVSEAYKGLTRAEACRAKALFSCANP